MKKLILLLIVPLISVGQIKKADFNIWNLNQVNLDVSYYSVSKKVNYALNDGKELIDKVV